MKKTKIIILAVIITVITSISFYSCARKAWTPEARAEKIVKKLVSKLNLNQEQTAKLYQIKNELLAKSKENRMKRVQIRNEIVSQIRGSSVDTEKINKVFSESEDKRIETRKYFITKFAEFHAVLTPEQRNKLADMVLKLSRMFLGE